MARLTIVIALIIVMTMMACSWRERDFCWISDTYYNKARELYLKTGSLEIVKQTLKDNYWTPGEINEAVYRLKKEFHLEEE